MIIFCEFVLQLAPLTLHRVIVDIKVKIRTALGVLGYTITDNLPLMAASHH